MKALPGALALALLLGLVAAAGLAPALRFAQPAGDGHPLWGGLEGLPARGTLLIEAPRLAYTPAEAAALRGFLEGGGRVLVAEPSAAANSLLRAADIDIQAPGSLVFDPDVDPEGRFTVTASGVLDAQGTLPLASSQVILGGGQSLWSTGPFVWQDLDADGGPDLGEPRGSWSVARLVAIGNGSILVLGSPALAQQAVVQLWVAGGGPLLLDARHNAGPDALGAADALAGHNPGAILGVLVAGCLAAAGVAFGVRLRRIGGRRRRGPVDRQTLEILAELSP